MTKGERGELIRILLAAALLAVCLCLRLEGWAKLAVFLVPYLIAGAAVLWEAVKNIARGELFDENFLMSLATLGALTIGEYPEAVAVMLLYRVGELFEDMAVDRSRRSITALMDIRPDHACVLRGGGELAVAPSEVAVGESIVVRPGERVPLDGVLESEATTLDTAALTGESMPRDCRTGDGVVSGAINLGAAARIRVTSVYGESTVARILALMESSAERKARSESFITRFARIYTPCVVAAAVLLALVPPLLFGGVWRDWLNRALIFLVVSCPCALVISVPLSFFGGIGGASKRGILIKGSDYLETLARVSVMVFDKTGTLTQGSFSVAAIHPQQVSEAELLDIAALAESYSNHPIAASILRAHGGHIDRSRIGEIQEEAGRGIRALIDGKRVCAGNGALMDEAGADWHECSSHAGTVVHIAIDGSYCGHIVISDTLKPEAAEALGELRRLGVQKTVMLTGDVERVSRAVGEQLKVDEVYAGLLPDGKLMQVERLLAEKPAGTALAFVGDGVNDAPVLCRADVGVAMGALGSDAAIEAADVVLMDDRLQKLPEAVRLSRRTMRIVRQNIVFALAVKAAVLLLGALGMANMWIAVFADVGVSVLAILNAVRAYAPSVTGSMKLSSSVM